MDRRNCVETRIVPRLRPEFSAGEKHREVPRGSAPFLHLPILTGRSPSHAENCQHPRRPRLCSHSIRRLELRTAQQQSAARHHPRHPGAPARHPRCPAADDHQLGGPLDRHPVPLASLRRHDRLLASAGLEPVPPSQRTCHRLPRRQPLQPPRHEPHDLRLLRRTQSGRHPLRHPRNRRMARE